MTLELNLSSNVCCIVCGQTVAEGRLRVTKKRYRNTASFFHLDCYRPDKMAPVRPDYFDLKKLTEQKHLDDVNSWADNWNKKFVAAEDKVPEQYLAKAVSTVPSPARRQLLEVFAFLRVQEIETKAAYTCKEWFHVTRDSELWKVFFIREFRPPDSDNCADYRKKYIAYYLGACVGCNKIVGYSQIERRCQFYNRIICTKCNSLPEFKIISLKTFKERTHFTSPALKLLQLPEFMYLRTKSCYANFLEERAVAYAEKRLSRLVELLRTTYADRVRREDVEAIAALNVRDFYIEEKKCLTAFANEVYTFCGKCEKDERIEKNVEVLLQHIGT